MAKKTFETTIKLVISSADIADAFREGLDFFELDQKIFNKFKKSYDWDTILNSEKFNKHFSRCIKTFYTMTSFEVCSEFFDNYQAENKKVLNAYDKFLEEHKKIEPTITSKYCLTLEGKKTDIEKALNTIKSMSDVTIECL